MTPKLKLIQGGAGAGNGSPPAPISELLTAIRDAFNGNELWRLEPFAGDHVVEHLPVAGGVDFRQRAEMLHEILPDARIEITDVVAQGSFVAWRWTISGTHRGKWLGVEPTGRSASLSGISVDRLEDGRVAEHWELPDLHAFAQQFEDPPSG